MKRKLTVLLLTVITVCITCFSSYAQSNQFNGTWHFSAPDSPEPGFSAGTITFSKRSGTTIADFNFTNGEKLTAEPVAINRDTASFTLNIQGELVRFKMVAVKELLKGTATLTDSEIIPFTAKRK
jgi:hypothetical protein